MRTRSAKWFECSVAIERATENGMQHKVNETYVVDALSFGEAEEQILKELAPLATGELTVKNINPAAYGEVFFSNAPADDRWYKAKVTFITIDEKTAKEKRTSASYLVQAATFTGAVKNVEEVMGKSMMDWVIANVAETKIMDVFEHQSSADKAEEK